MVQPMFKQGHGRVATEITYSSPRLEVLTLWKSGDRAYQPAPPKCRVTYARPTHGRTWVSLVNSIGGLGVSGLESACGLPYPTPGPLVCR